MNFPKLVCIKPVELYKLHLRYDDGTEGVLDLSDLKGQGVFDCWEKNENFFKVYINPEGGGITWNEQLDICPNAAYLNLKNLSFEEWKYQNSEHASTE